MSNALDLDQLQAQIELKRSALADSILSKLPSLGGPSAAASSSSAASASTSRLQESVRPRQANLGVGATPKQQEGDSNGSFAKSRSAADVRLKGALSAKRKRWQDDEPKASTLSDSDDDEASRTNAILAVKKSKQSINGATTSATASSKSGKKDPFAAKGIESQKASQNQPRIVVLDGESIDLSKLSKTQRKKINKQLKAQQEQEQGDDEQVPKAAAASPVSTKPLSASPVAAAAQLASAKANGTQNGTSAALTPLQAQMLSKLSGSRFRTINEKLYTTASDEAVRMIDAAPAMFDEYHQGFREQVRSWPKNPLDRIVELFDSSRADVPGTAKGKGKKKVAQHQSAVSSHEAKARFTPGALVVDLGAGEGGLAKKLVPKGVKVLCYDLITTSDGWVRKQDTAAIGGLPLPGYFAEADPLGLQTRPNGTAEGIADVAVFCLSLMGTNWVHMLLEAKRVLRTGGELIIAEVSSRFADGFDAFIRIVKMLGFGLEHKDASNTHFVLFEFVKLSQRDHLSFLSRIDGDGAIDPENTSLDQLAEHGKTLLKPCIYKRR
ncbi:25S rRNA (adenine(645)-N(1))-methyltransferase [Pseudozyma hubeiensis]|nr:25S rRNA (adenine(645)-N(1))-methyltransferase [Pseudozyma hubeiensis]